MKQRTQNAPKTKIASLFEAQKSATRAGQEGTAMAESVVALPFFILIFAALIMMWGLYATKLDLAVRARRCAWNYTISNYCESTPAGCDGATFAEWDSSSAGTGAAESEMNSALSGVSSVVRNVVSAVFGEIQNVRFQRDMVAPTYLGGATNTVLADYSVVCNERPKSLGELIEEIVCSINDNFC